MLKFLDSERGKIRINVFRVSTSKDDHVLSGSFVAGLIQTAPQNPTLLILSDIKTILAMDNIRDSFHPMGFTFFAQEILDYLVLEGDLFPYYNTLFHAFHLFNETMDETHILFFLAQFLSKEGWLNIPECTTLDETLIRFIHYAHTAEHQTDIYDLSQDDKKHLSLFFAQIVKQVRHRMPRSVELLRFR